MAQIIDGYDSAEWAGHGLVRVPLEPVSGPVDDSDDMVLIFPGSRAKGLKYVVARSWAPKDTVLAGADEGWEMSWDTGWMTGADAIEDARFVL
ncbi:hypothetical protein R8Z50_34520 [Longispora sp. K20-0274]|uniref:hypothetical protein n=1 Tax=Longispora sp. K20-0274 TaxID=3088255 RepID=UPI0039994E3B